MPKEAGHIATRSRPPSLGELFNKTVKKSSDKVWGESEADKPSGNIFGKIFGGVRKAVGKLVGEGWLWGNVAKGGPKGIFGTPGRLYLRTREAVIEAIEGPIFRAGRHLDAGLVGPVEAIRDTFTRGTTYDPKLEQFQKILEKPDKVKVEPVTTDPTEYERWESMQTTLDKAVEQEEALSTTEAQATQAPPPREIFEQQFLEALNQVRGFYGLRDVTLTQNSALRRQARGRARLINEVKGDAAELQAKTMPLRYLLVPRLERGKGESVHLQKRTVITADGINEIMVEPADQFETRWQQVEKKRQQASPLETPTYFAKANGHRLTPMANPARLLRELLESKDLAYREILLRPDAKEIALGVEPGENFSLAIFTTGKYGGRATPPRQRGKQEREHFAGDLEKPFREDFWYRQIPREEKEANDIDRLKNDPHSPFRAPFYDLYCLSRFLTQAKKLVGPAHQAKIRGDIKENRAMVAGGDTYEAVIVSDFPPKKEEYRLIPGFDLVEVPREKTEPTLRRKGRDEQAPATAKERITLQEFYRRLRKKLAGVPAPEERERRPPPGPTPPPQPEDPDEPEEEDPVDDE